MYYKVPQKINLEDKVIGPLTFRQFLYLLGGFLPSFIIAKILEKTGINLILGMIICFPIWTPSLILAFFKFQDQGLDKILAAFLQFATMPKTLLWDKKSFVPSVKIAGKKKKIIQYMRPKTLESRLQLLHEQITIYGLQPKEKERIISEPKKNLIIKSFIRPLRKLPQQESGKASEYQKPEISTKK